MQILDNLIILLLPVIAFIAGMKISDRYHRQAETDKRYYLQKQYLRLQTNSDADDPCQPYVNYENVKNELAAGDYDGDELLGQDFAEKLKTEGRAVKKFRKADIAL